MNTNPDAKNVLCFGDSNTHGRSSDGGRFGPDERWTGILQTNLGNDYYVIEEGIGGRTTDLEYPGFPGRNGRQYLQPCLQSHYPIDTVILMLGTNDFKTEFHRSVEDITNAIDGLLDDITVLAASPEGKPPHIILVSPILLNDEGPAFKKKDRYARASVEKSLKLAEALEVLANKRGIGFFDAAQVAKAGQDGIHMDLPSHKALGEALTKLVFSG